MAEKQGYQVGEEVVETLAEVAGLLGVSRVVAKDIKEGGKYADKVQIVTLEDTEADEDTAPEDNEDDETDDTSKQELLEALPEFESIDELKEFIKDIDTPTLEYFAKGLGLTWTQTNHASIHRMYMAQAMHKHFFPELFKPKSDKKKAKFGDYSTEKLYGLVKENNLNVKRSGNEPIDRMRAIQALKTVGVLPSE